MSIFLNEEQLDTAQSKNNRILQALPSQPPQLPLPHPAALKTKGFQKGQGRKSISPHTPQQNRRVVSFINPRNQPSDTNLNSQPSGNAHNWQTSCQVLAVGSPRRQDIQNRLPIPPNVNYQQKARMIRELNIKIELLEAKAKQPGVALEDLQPLREEIYNKFDNYEIGNFNIEKVRQAQKLTKLEPVLSNFALKKQRSLLAEPPLEKLNSRVSFIQRNFEEVKRSKRPSNSIKQSRFNHGNMYALGDELEQASSILETTRGRMIELNLGEDDLAMLDRSPLMQPSEYSEDEDPRVLQLEESVRVMQERIGFLIQRLQEGRKEVQVHKEEKERVYVELKETLKSNLVNVEKVSLLQPKVKEMTEKCMEFEIRQAETIKEIEQLEKINSQYENQLPVLAEEIQYLSSRLKQKEEQFGNVVNTLDQKAVEYNQCRVALRNLEEQYTIKRQQMLEELYESQKINNNLKKAIKELTVKLELDGVNMKIQEAEKLKSYIDDHVVIHQRQIEHIDKSYSSMLSKHLDQNKILRKEKARLERALIQWMIPFEGGCECPVNHEEVTFEDIPSKICGFTAQRISKAFLQAVSSMQKANRHAKEAQQESSMFRERLLTIREKHDEKMTAKIEQVEKLTSKYSDLLKYNKVLRDEKQDLLNELTEQKQMITYVSPHATKLALVNNNVQFHYPETITDYLPRGAKMGLDTILKNPSRFSLQQRVSMVVALLEHSNKMSHYTRFQRKMPPLLPSRLTFKRTDEGIEVELSKVEDNTDQGLLYRAPEVLLGFNQTTSSHCWSAGIILDQLIHGKEFYKKCDQILSRTDNYYIRGEQYRRLEMLHKMLRKNSKQRLGLLEAKMLLEEYLAFLKL